jgi:hypothetical protein
VKKGPKRGPRIGHFGPFWDPFLSPPGHLPPLYQYFGEKGPKKGSQIWPKMAYSGTPFLALFHQSIGLKAGDGREGSKRGPNMTQKGVPKAWMSFFSIGGAPWGRPPNPQKRGFWAILCVISSMGPARGPNPESGGPDLIPGEGWKCQKGPFFDHFLTHFWAIFGSILGPPSGPEKTVLLT